jgi:hypothetical protein
MLRPSTLAILVPFVLGTGCTTMGTGFGATASGSNPVHFRWQSTDDVSGRIYATLADGSVYTGRYFQVMTNTTADSLEPLWAGWGPDWGWGSWDYWNEGPDFVTHYSGHVVANLADPEGKHIRCNFQLIHRDSGMAGGGSGNCQLPNGKTINTSFPGTS